MAGQANSLISHGSLVGTIKISNAATNSLVGRLNVDNTITGRMDTSSLTGALDTDNAITSQSGSISTDDQIIGVLNANNTIAGGVGTAYNPAYALVDEAAAQIVLYINNTDYKFYAELKDKNGSHIANSNIIDLPLESMVVNGSYDSTNKEIVLTLNNGNTLRFSVADLVSGLVSTTDLSTVLLNYVEFTDYANGTNAGVIKTSSSYATETSDGVLRAQNKTYAQYESLSNNAFIGKGTLDNAIAGKELTNKTYVDNADKVFEDDLFNSGYVTSEGTSMSLDVKTGKPEIELKGNTIQASTPTPDNPQSINVVSGRQEVDIVGKNLFDYRDLTTKTNAGLTIINTNSELSISGTSTSTSFLNIIVDTLNLKAGTYTMSAFNPIASSDSGMDLRITKTGGSDIVASVYLNVANNKKTFTLSEDLVNGRLIIRTSNGQTLTNFKLSPMIEKGNQATTYEPFKGQSYEINLGKNLLNIDGTRTSEGLTNITSGTIISVSGTSSNTYSSLTQQITQNIPIGTYTFSIQETYSKRIGFIAMFSDNTNTTYNITANQLSTTFTTTKEIKSYRIYMETTSGTTYNMTIKPQLEKGSIASSFSPYKTPIELCKIRTYQDRIYKENGTWYLHKEIGKVVLDGSETYTGVWWDSSVPRKGARVDISNALYPTDASQYLAILGDKYTSYSQELLYRDTTFSNYVATGICIRANNSQLIIKNNNLTLSSETASGVAQAVKEWVTTNGLTVYYPLATPTTTEITDSELISQLNGIELLEGLNNVSVSSGDLPGIIKIKAFSNTTAGSITKLEKIVEFLGDSIGDIGTLLDEIQGEVI